MVRHKEHHNNAETGYNLRDFILGGQDGLVNVLGVILAVAIAVSDSRIVIIAGLAATFAESISMAAVAYTSTKAARDFYRSELEREKKEIEEMPDIERKEIKEIYFKKGFRGTMLNAIVSKLTSNKDVWVKVMMEDEMHLYPDEYKSPMRDALIVGFSALIGSFVPLIPFFLLPVQTATIGAIVASIVILFAMGYIKGKLTTGKTLKSGVELAVIGMAAALAGYAIGAVLGVALYA